MKKHIQLAALAGVAVLSAAAMSNAATLELNLYGASAQADFWKATAPTFLSSLGCKTSTGTTLAAANVVTNGKHNFLKGYNCTTSLVPGQNDSVEFAFSGVSSVEAIAVAGGASQYNNGGSCADPFQRKMATAATTATAANLACKTVHIGTTDLDAASFMQSSTGNLNGPAGNGSLTSVPTYAWPNGLTMDNAVKVNGTELIVPFAFFVNNAVTANQCTAGAAAKLGDLCTTASDCGTGGACTSQTISNLTREQAAMLFSQQVLNWRDFGPAYSDMPAVACLRHAGSGTAAAFDMMVVSGGATGWGASLSSAENTDPAAGTVTYFNDSTDAEIACVFGAASATDTTGRAWGAIGYADADKGLTSMKTAAGATYDASGRVSKIKYNGVQATAANINNGIYDWYSVGAMYINPNNALQNQLAETLASYTANVANIPGSKTAYWTTVSNTTFVRGADNSYPGRR